MDRLSGFVRRRRRLCWACGSCCCWSRSRSPRGRPSTSPAAASRCPARARRRSTSEIDALPAAPAPSRSAVVLAAQGRRSCSAPAIDRVRRGRGEGRRHRADHGRRGAGRRAAQDAWSLVPLTVDRRPRRRARRRQGPARRSSTSARSRDGVQPYVVGQQALWAGMQELQQEDLAQAERTGFPAILIVLLAVFGSLLAALLPVGLGVAAVIVTGAAIYFLALATTMSVFVTNVASMLGIGVAVDYSLFLLSRYREEMHRGTRPRRGARHRDAHLRRDRRLLRHDRDRVARRAVPARLDGRCARWRSARSSSSRSRSSAPSRCCRR